MQCEICSRIRFRTVLYLQQKNEAKEVCEILTVSGKYINLMSICFHKYFTLKLIYSVLDTQNAKDSRKEGLLQYEVSGCILTFRMFHIHSIHFHHQRNLLHRSRWSLLQPQCLLTPLRMQCLAQLPQTEAQGTNKPWLSTIRSYYMQQPGPDSYELQSSLLHHNDYDSSPECEVDHSHPPRATVWNTWSYTCIIPSPH